MKKILIFLIFFLLIAIFSFGYVKSISMTGAEASFSDHSSVDDNDIIISNDGSDGYARWWFDFCNLVPSPNDYTVDMIYIEFRGVEEGWWGDRIRSFSLFNENTQQMELIDNSVTENDEVYSYLIYENDVQDYFDPNWGLVGVQLDASGDSAWRIKYVYVELYYSIDPKLDLSLTNLSGPSRVNADEEFSLSMIFKNVGDLDFYDDIYFRYYLNERYIGSEYIDSVRINAGSQYSYETTFELSTEGNHELKLCVDVDDDTNSNNDCDSISIEVLPPLEKDLIITNVLFNPNEIEPGDTVYFDVTVKNIGDGDYKGDLDFKFYADLDKQGQDSANSIYIGSGNSKTYPLSEKFDSDLEYGCYDLIVVLDPDPEDTNTDNNDYNAGSICVVRDPPDLSISSINIPGELIEGESKTIKVTVYNSGYDFNGDFKIELNRGTYYNNYSNKTISQNGYKTYDFTFVPKEMDVGKNKFLHFELINVTGEENDSNNEYEVTKTIRPVFNVSGYVYAGGTSYGVNDVIIELLNTETSEKLITTTQSDGSYNFSDVVGYYPLTLTPVKDNHEFDPKKLDISSDNENNLSNKIFRDNSSFPITGKVLFKANKYWDYWDIGANSITISDKNSSAETSTENDNLGDYSITLLVGNHDLEPSTGPEWEGVPIDFAPTSRSIFVTQSADMDEFKITTVREITGSITSAGANGHPLTDPDDPTKGVKVTIGGGSPSFQGTITYTSPETGLYRFEVPPNNPDQTYTITPYDYGGRYKYGEPYQEVDVMKENKHNVDFKIPIPVKLTVTPKAEYSKDTLERDKDDSNNFDVYEDGELIPFTCYATDTFNDYVYDYNLLVYNNGELIEEISVEKGSEEVVIPFTAPGASLALKNLHFEIDGLGASYCDESEGSILHHDRNYYVTGYMPLTENSSSTIAEATGKMPIFVLHDPPTDHGYSYIEKSTTIERGWGFSFEGEAGIKRSVSIGADVEIISVGMEAIVDVTIKGGYSNFFNTIETWTERTETSSDENSNLIGPGRGDVICAMLPTYQLSITYEIIFDEANKNVYKDKDNPIIVVIPLRESNIVYITAYSIVNDYLNNDNIPEDQKANWRKILDYDFGFDNTIDSSEEASVTSKGAIQYNGGIGIENSYNITDSETYNYNLGLIVDSSFAANAGVKAFGIGVEGKVEIHASIELGAAVVNNNTYEKTTGVILNDNDEDDTFDIPLYEDLLFNTPMYLRGVGDTSKPWEGEPTVKGLNFTSQIMGDPEKTVELHDENDFATYELKLEYTGKYNSGGNIEIGVEDNPEAAKIRFNNDQGPINIPIDESNPVKSVEIEMYSNLDIYEGFEPTTFPATIVTSIVGDIIEHEHCIKTTFIDKIPPETWIGSPPENNALSGISTFYIETEHTDIEKIDLQYSKDRINWEMIGSTNDCISVVPSTPRNIYRYKIDFDSTTKEDGTCYIRAIGYDVRNNYESLLKSGKTYRVANDDLKIIAIEPANRIMPEWSTPLIIKFNKNINPDTVTKGLTIQSNPQFLQNTFNVSTNGDQIEIRFSDDSGLGQIEDNFEIIVTTGVKALDDVSLSENETRIFEPPNPRTFKLVLIEPEKNLSDGMFIPIGIVKPPELSLITYDFNIEDSNGKIIFNPVRDNVATSTDYEKNLIIKVEKIEEKYHIAGSVQNFKDNIGRFLVLFYLMVDINDDINKTPNINISDFIFMDENGEVISSSSAQVLKYDYWTLVGDIHGNSLLDYSPNGELDIWDLSRFAASYPSKEGDDNYSDKANIGPRTGFKSGINDDECYKSGSYNGTTNEVNSPDLGIFAPMYLNWQGSIGGSLDKLFRDIIKWHYENGEL